MCGWVQSSYRVYDVCIPSVRSLDLRCDSEVAFIPIVMVEHVELILQLTEGSSDLRTDVISSVNLNSALTLTLTNGNSVKDFRMELGKYCIACGFEVDFKKNDHSRVTAVCSKSKTEGCQWFIHAVLRRSDGSFIIKKLVNEHNCSGRIMGRKSKMVL
ncbi:hypothetical protein LguiB_032033 [Lonicera macranthoides]